MSQDDTVSGATDERVRFIKHKGQDILVIDFSNCSSKEMLLLLDLVLASVKRHAPGSLLTLADFTGTHIDKKVAERAKEVLVLDRPYVKKSAWVGTQNLPHVFYENFKSFSQRDFPIFATREEAMDWLVKE
jgi:hypothetical protein